MDIPPPNPDQSYLLEQSQRFSKSLIWDLQKKFYARQGIEAWRQGVVPHYITNNHYIADSYARLVLAFLRDCQNAGTLDATQPIYIVELGAGSGRLGFHFLKKLLKILPQTNLKDLTIKYVMTDFAEANLEFWRKHPPLKTLAKQGYLDFARYEAGQDHELTLLHSNERLYSGSLKNPLIVLANYFFDSIPPDIFSIKDGELGLGLVSISATEPNPDLSDPDLLSKVSLTYEQQPLSEDFYQDFYQDPICNQILQEYVQSLDNTILAFPSMAIDCIRNLGQFSADRLLLIVGDKGFKRADHLVGLPEPGLSLHGGGFSLMVNFHALSQYFLKRGGFALNSIHQPQNLTISLFGLGVAGVETRQSYQAAIEQFGPDDFFAIIKGLENSYRDLSLAQILAYLRLSQWDTQAFLSCFPTLLEQSENLTIVEREDLYQVVQEIWEVYYPLSEKVDLAFYLGMLLYSMAFFPESLGFFNCSIQDYGANASTLYNMAMCYYNLGQLTTALAYIDKTLHKDPAFEPAKATRLMIQNEIKLQSGV